MRRDDALAGGAGGSVRVEDVVVVGGRKLVHHVVRHVVDGDGVRERGGHSGGHRRALPIRLQAVWRFVILPMGRYRGGGYGQVKSLKASVPEGIWAGEDAEGGLRHWLHSTDG